MSAARAVQTRSAADIERAMSLNLEAAQSGLGYAENAIQLAIVLGRLDTAFDLARAYFSRTPLGRGFSAEQGVYYRERHTVFLFMPSSATFRADPRFDDLMSSNGLKAYWAKSGHGPDFMSAGPV